MLGEGHVFVTTLRKWERKAGLFSVESFFFQDACEHFSSKICLIFLWFQGMPNMIVRRLDIVYVISAKSAYRKKKTSAKAEWLICGMLDWVHLKWMKWNSEKCFKPRVSWEWCRVSPSLPPSLRFLQWIHSTSSMDECLMLLHSHCCKFVFLLPNNKGEP